MKAVFLFALYKFACFLLLCYNNFMIRSKVASFLLILCCYSLSFAQYDGYDLGYDEGYETLDDLGFEDEEYLEDLDVEESDPLALPDTAERARRAPPSSQAAAAAAMRSIPLFRDVFPTFPIDPTNPTLPANHPFLKFRGTVWRGSEQFFITNQRGVVSAQRMYLVFAKERDAASFTLAPYDSPTITAYPPVEDYVPLIPLIETNSVFASPYADKYIEIPEEYTRPTTNNMFLVNPSAQTNTNTPAAEAPTPTAPSTEALEPNEGISDVPIFDEYGDEYLDEGADEYLDEGDGEYLDELSFAPNFQFTRLIAQNAGASPAMTYAVVNLGGLEGGIFQIADPQGIATKFIILMMVLDKDGSLWAGTVRSSVDMRLNTAEAGQLREIYKKNLTHRVNLKKYSPVFQSETKAPDIFKFFK